VKVLEDEKKKAGVVHLLQQEENLFERYLTPHLDISFSDMVIE